MKTKILIFAALSLLIFGNASYNETLANSILNREDSIRVYSTPDLYNLTSAWAREFGNTNPNVKIKVSNVIDPQVTNTQNLEGSLYFVSNKYYSALNNKSILSMVVGVDAIVPIINSKNPFVEELNKQGISQEEIAKILTDPESYNWGTILSSERKFAVKYYSIKNESFESEIAEFLKSEKSSLKGTYVSNAEELITAIQKDPYAIGFCKISNIIDSKSQNIVQGISLLPIDKNSNGKIDHNEMIYGDLDALLRGVWIGKYPRELCGNIYSISSMKPSSENETAFLAWVLNNGQQYLNLNGYSELANNQKQANIDKLYSKEIVVNSSNNRYALPIVLGILATIIVVSFAIDFLIQRLRNKKTVLVNVTSDSSPFFDDNSVIVPEGLYFDKSHTWAFMEKDGIVGIGIDDFLQHVTGPITKIKMKEPGEKIKKGDPFLTIIQEGKQLIIKSPLSGTIKSFNKNLVSNASLLNDSPYNEGWIYKIEPTNWLRDIQFLIFAQGYKQWLKMEFLHLKDFLSVALRSDYSNKTQIVLQDGGVIKNGILKDLRPEIWEDFQTHFLDITR